jgi:hypothetical protein
MEEREEGQSVGCWKPNEKERRPKATAHLLQPFDVAQDLDVEVLGFVVDPRESVVVALDLGTVRR